MIKFITITFTMYKTQTIFHFPYPVPFTLKLSFIFPTLSPLPVFLCCVWRFLDSCQEPCRDISYEQWHCKLKSEWRNLIYKLFLLEVVVNIQDTNLTILTSTLWKLAFILKSLFMIMETSLSIWYPGLLAWKLIFALISLFVTIETDRYLCLLLCCYGNLVLL